ncbi:MAG: zinc ribbon domain-containing protein [Eggerthellaceae bacterium]|nr:zinc ribbon domain-containing protein [Eggerthellaceae bacterium]
MFCPQCGTENEDDARFCSSCGSSLDAALKVLEAEGSEAEGVIAGASEQLKAAPSMSSKSVSEHQSASQDEGEDARRQRGFNAGAAAAALEGGPMGDAAASALGDKKKLIGIVAVVVVVIVAALLWFNLSGAGTLGQTTGTFKTAFETSDIARKGAASNDFVNETPYSVTSFECTDISKSSDYEVTAHVKAVVENESFKTEVTALATYIDGTKLPSGSTWASGIVDGYHFDITSTATTPKKGVDKDDVNIAQAFESTLSDDGITSTVTITETEQTWFVDAEFETVHTYRFIDDRWTHIDAETTAAYDYHDIEGTYLPKGNSEVTFTIRDLDSEKGTFVVDYTAAESNVIYDYNVAGTLNVDIIATAKSDYTSKAVKGTYEFKGTGTSSGGDGQASVEGTLVVTDSGEPALKIGDLSIDYTFDQGRHSGRSRSGMLFKQ